ncbi:hypothetical protein SLE2022_283840 [Rubroshorea leprosula]
MAVSFRGRTSDFGVSRKWKEKGRERETSPERTIVWTEPKTQKSAERKVPVVYYLCRNGQLEHPHFMEVSLSSNDGLYLRDVINRLNVLRGQGMASLYSWSSKRSYRNGFVWQDLSENDFIYPAHGQEYVLKGSEILNPKLLEAASSFRLPKQAESEKSEEDPDFPVVTRRRNQSWSSIDLQEYKVYKTEANSESSRRLAADASTQTDDKQRRRKPEIEELEEEKTQSQSQSQELDQNQRTELSREEISPPPSDSSPETLESLMKAEGRLRLSECGSNEDSINRAAGGCPSGRMKASAVLMQLISCGSISFKDCGPSSEKDQGFSLIGQYKARLPRGAGNNGQVGSKDVGIEREIGNVSRVKLEDKEYFSGSLIETKKQEAPALKRSSSYNADRSSQLQLAEKEIEGVNAMSIPRNSQTLPTKKEEISSECSTSTEMGSKRHDA